MQSVQCGLIYTVLLRHTAKMFGTALSVFVPPGRTRRAELQRPGGAGRGAGAGQPLSVVLKIKTTQTRQPQPTGIIQQIANNQTSLFASNPNVANMLVDDWCGEFEQKLDK